MVLSLWLGLASFFGLGLTSILSGPVASEAVPVAMTSSAIGIVSGIGEIFGGGIGPIAAGYVASGFGIAAIMFIPMIGLTIGAIVSIFLRETAPRHVEKNASAGVAGG